MRLSYATPVRGVECAFALLALIFASSYCPCRADDPASSEPPAASAPVLPLPAPTRTDPSVWSGGVPLGGIGTGTVELRGDGSFREWQIFNNWGDALTLGVSGYPSHPSYDLLNSFAAIKVNGHAVVLETNPPAGLPGVPAITYTGNFPFCELSYGMPSGTPVAVSVEGFGSFIPHDDANSGIPAFGLTYRIKNVSSSSVTISLALSIVNPYGQECLVDSSGPSPVVESLDDGAGIGVSALDDLPISIAGGNDDNDTLRSFWTNFAGAHPDYSSSGQGARAAQVVSFTVAPGATKSERFVVGWYFPNHHENASGPFVGQKYEAWSHAPVDSIHLFESKFETLRAQSAAWEATLTDSSWPTWVTHWLVNSQSTMAKNTWWTEDGRFMNYESTECPNGSPVHILDLADWPVVDEFPDLELRLLRQFAANESPAGDIPEQFNYNGGPGITFPGGRPLYDKNPKYAMEVYHRWRETGDRAFLDACWPAVKKAILYEPRYDGMKIGVPSGPSIIGTWDHWDNEFLPSYGATVWLGGLKAAEAIAKVEGDAEFVAQAEALFQTGLATLNDHLWNGEFYAMTTDKNLNQDDLSFCESTYGDDFARFIGLGGVIPDDRALSTLRAIARYNSAPTRFGIVVTADTTGKMVEYDGDVRAQITTCHAMPAPIALIQEGDDDDIQTGLKILHSIYSIGDLQPGGLWNLPHHVVATTGARNVFDFSHYLRDRAIWALLKILNGWSYDAPDQTLAIGPVLMPSNCYGPWICSVAYGKLSQQISGRRQDDLLEAREGVLTLKGIDVKSNVGPVYKATVTWHGSRMPSSFTQVGNMTVVKFSAPVEVGEGTPLHIALIGANM